MENRSDEVNEKKLEDHQASLFHSYHCESYERAMDKISLQFSDYEEAFEGSSRNSLTKATENHEKKMKISLSQEQLRLNGSGKNFLSVPKSTKKSASFSSSDKKDAKNSLRSESSSRVQSLENLNLNQVITVTPPTVERNEIIYAVPRKLYTLQTPHFSKKQGNELKTSSASSLPSKSVTIAQTSSTSELDRNFKYPLSFYCKICNNVLSDPRTLDCLHSFCVQCLARIDVTNDLQNNQFWRKISDSSCELEIYGK